MKPADFLRALERCHDMPPAACPQCQERLDQGTGVVDDDAPKPGDIAVCFICEAPLEYQADLSFRLMTDAEVAALPEKTLLSLLDAIEGAHSIRKAKEAMRSTKANAHARGKGCC